MAALEMMRDRTALFEIAVTQEAVALTLAGKSMVFAAKENLSDGTVLISKSSPSGGITIATPSSGLAVLQIDPADTAALSNIQSHTLVWDLRLIDGALEYSVASGTLKVLGNVGS